MKRGKPKILDSIEQWKSNLFVCRPSCWLFRKCLKFKIIEYHAQTNPRLLELKLQTSLNTVQTNISNRRHGLYELGWLYLWFNARKFLLLLWFTKCFIFQRFHQLVQKRSECGPTDWSDPINPVIGCEWSVDDTWSERSSWIDWGTCPEESSLILGPWLYRW
jgi:hypothetical protein